MEFIVTRKESSCKKYPTNAMDHPGVNTKDLRIVDKLFINAKINKS